MKLKSESQIGSQVQKTLDDTSFWTWMATSYTASSGGINEYLRVIANNEVDKGYLVELLSDNSFTSHSPIMKNLRQCMPRGYFLEIQYCASLYATVLGKIFPPLSPQVDQLAYIEWLLYTEPGYPSYRDHLVHMFKVAFVGDQLLSVETLLSKITEWQFRSKHFQDWYLYRKIRVDKWNPSEQKEVVKIALFLAALFHDFGYGYFFFKKYKQRLFKLYQWLLPGADPTDIDALGTRTLLQSLPAFFVQKHHAWLSPKTSNIRDNIIAGFFRDCLPLNHSIASSFFVIDVAEKLLNSRALTQKLYVAFQLAAEACMIHDMTKINAWAHLREKKNGHFIDCNEHRSIPLAMLLVLADELSVWNRPTLKMVMNDENGVTHSLDRSNVPSKMKIYVSERKRVIKIVPNRAHTTIKKTFFEDLTCFKQNEKDNNSKILGYLIDVSSSN